MLGCLTDEVIEHLLTNQWFGRLGCAVGSEVLVVPITYYYDGHNIYGHTREGTKTRLMRQNPSVCLEVDELVSSTLWRSVVVHGLFEELTGDERRWALQQLGQRQPPRFAHGLSLNQPDEISGPEGHEAPATVVYRLRITGKAGRSEQRAGI